MEVIIRLLKKKYILFMIISVILFGLAGVAYNVLIKNRQKGMVIEFNYPGSEKGLNPDGSVFEISELKSPAVIRKAKENLKDQKIDTEFLRTRIFITTKVSNQTIDKIVSAVQSEKNVVYMPTAFYIYYTQKDKFSTNESAYFMECLAEAYTEYFSAKYTEKNDILIFDSSNYDFDSIDYLEIYQILSSKADSMLKYIKAHQNENRAFYSDDGVNLGMAAKRLESFRDISLEKFYSYVVQNGVSKDRTELLSSIEYYLWENEIEYRKLIEGSEIVKDVTKAYDQDIAVAFVPSVDAKHNFYMSRTKTGIDYLTTQSYNDGISASRVLQNIEYYRNLKEKFSSPRTGRVTRQTADNMIADLVWEMEKISQEVLKIDNEYLEHKTSDYFTVHLPQQERLSVGLIAKFMLLGAFLAFLAILFDEFVRTWIYQRAQMFETAFAAAEKAKKENKKKGR